MIDESASQPANEPPTREQEIARQAARLLKNGKPQFKRLMAFTRPRAESAGREAARYVREHESEIKDAAVKLAQARLRGPLGMVVGSLANGISTEKSAPAFACPDCRTVNPPAANFCSECGRPLASKPESQ